MRAARLSNAVAILCLVSFITTLALWLRSYFVCDAMGYAAVWEAPDANAAEEKPWLGSKRNLRYVVSSRGCVGIVFSNAIVSAGAAGWSWQRSTPYPFHPV